LGKTQTSILLLLAAVFALFWARVYEVNRLSRRSTDLFIQARAADKKILLDRLLELKGSSLATLAFDYTFWSEMVRFLETKDPGWAADNLDSALLTFQAEAIWVYDLQWRLVYAAKRPGVPAIPVMPLPAPERSSVLGRQRFCHFFAATPAGLLEVRGATIHPDNDRERRTPPRGYFFAARLWNAPYLEEISRLAEARLEIRPADRPLPGGEPRVEPDQIFLFRDLPDWRGLPLRKLQLQATVPMAGSFERLSRQQSNVLMAFSLVILVILAYILLLQVYRPLHRISLSLKGEDEAPLLPLMGKRSEFGQIAIMLAHTFQQKTRLEREFTERLEVEKELEKAKVSAEAALKAKSIFVATMSHEIRTPLNAVIGFSDLLLNTGLDETQQGYAGTIAESGRLLLSLVNDVLDTAKLETGQVKLELIDFDLDNLVQGAIRIVQPRLQKKPVTITLQSEEGMEPFYNGDPTRLRQILLNLLSNAVKFTARGTITVTLRPLPPGSGDSPDRRRLSISVRDTGIGISTEMQQRIFEPFIQADMSTTRTYGGTGLGLSISRQLAALMGGTIALESQPGQGSCFTLVLKLKRGKPETEFVVPLRREETAGRRVLLIDNNQPLRQYIAGILETQGICVAHQAADGAEARSWLDAQPTPPDLVICDMQMPDLDGHEFARSLRAIDRYRYLPLMVLTSSPMPGAARRAEESGYDAFLPKPVTPADLRRVVRTTLGKRRGGPIVTRHLSEEVSLRGRRVLVAEDNPINQKLMVRLLEKFGCTVFLAGDGNEALAQAGSIQPEIVLMDLQMPGLDGREAARALRQRGFAAPIVALTASTLAEEIAACRQAGMDDFLGKPVQPALLRDTLSRWLE
jgi:signal transduction histidine kinase/CheY-like chemotaxis protein